MRQILFFIGIIILSGCISPRTVTESGKVTPRGQFKAGFNYAGNIPTAAASSVYNQLKGLAGSYLQQDSVILNDELTKVNKALVAYALDPIGAGIDLYARYGVYDHVDVGYRYAWGTHVLDAKYQFLGSTKSMKNSNAGGWYGSAGLQFSTQSYELVNSFIDKASSMLFDFEMKRKDFLIPVIFSYSLGNEEKIGAVSFGMILGQTFTEYNFNPENFYKITDNAVKIPVEPINEKKHFTTIGGFFNFKVGYKYVYLVPAFAVYYQNYGDYRLLDGNNHNISGYTFVPSIGLQFHIPTGKY